MTSKVRFYLHQIKILDHMKFDKVTLNSIEAITVIKVNVNSEVLLRLEQTLNISLKNICTTFN